MRRAVAIMALGTSAVFASDAHAQRLDRTKRPLVGDPAPFAFPEMQARMLSNGLRVVVIENHALPLVSVRAAVAVDSIDDPVGKEGLFVLTAGLLREGTTTRAGDQLSSAAALLGNAVFPFRFTTKVFQVRRRALPGPWTIPDLYGGQGSFRIVLSILRAAPNAAPATNSFLAWFAINSLRDNLAPHELEFEQARTPGFILQV